MRRSQSRTRDIMSLGGWLFADLLLALAMLFFTTSIIVTPVHSTPTPTRTPKPTTAPRLELEHRKITLSIDASGILQDVPGAIDDVKRQIQAQAFLRNRKAGLVIVYGGALTINQVNTALTIAQKIYAILKMLGKEGFVFSRASYYDPLYVLGNDLNTTILDIYLFAQ